MNFSNVGGKDGTSGDVHSGGNEHGSPGKKIPPADIPISTLVLAGVGGMLLFLGSFFGLIAAIGIGGFLIPALVILTIGALMLLVAWLIWRQNRVRYEKSVEKEIDRLLCDYCGGQNAEGDLQCRFCGAPLR